MTSTLFAVCVCWSILGAGAERSEIIDVEKVWTGHPVGFSLLTSPPLQFVAYYNAERQMTVAQRNLNSREWTFVKLPTRVGWDSHNYVTMAVDRAGHLHVAGNMHCVPLIYFRTSRPGDAQSLERVAHMVGPERERHVTYPVFLRGPSDQLIFRYRDGRSGNGDDIYNGYDEATRSWRRLIDQPLTSGEGKMNAYCSRPQLGPDHRYHIVWVWRDTPDCATNHDLSYACSADLVHWETAGGKPLELPITLGSGAVVDPVPPGGGMINGGHRLGFDRQNRPVIAYHKFDSRGNTQIYIARFEESAWKIRQISNWEDYRWEFQGGGSIPFEVRLGSVRRVDEGLEVSCVYGRGRAQWTLDEATLTQIDPAPGTGNPSQQAAGTVKTARDSDTVDSAGGTGQQPAPRPAGLQVRYASDLGVSDSPEHHYRLRWYAAAPNRDRPRSGPVPDPVMLQVVTQTVR